MTTDNRPDHGTVARTRRRAIASVAFVLGALGAVLAIGFAILMAWFGVRAASTVDEIVAEVNAATERLDARLAQAVDLVDQPQQANEFGARLDSLGDAARGARLSVDGVEDHPLYSLLPTRFSRVAATTAEIDAAAQGLGQETADRVEDRLATIGAATSRLDAEINDAGTSLRKWIRLAAIVLILLALWSLWAQVSLARSGWRRMQAG